jgi:hypothetical protein
MEAVWSEVKELRQIWALLAFGLIAAYVDGLVIAQCWDWISNTGRMSIWLLY